TIDLSLTDVKTSTLSVGDFNVNGYTGTPADYTAGDLTDKYGTDVPAAAAADITGSDGAAFAGTLTKDTNGNYFVKDGDGKHYAASVKVVDGSADGTTTPPSLKVSVDSEEAVGVLTGDPLATIDKALASVDSARSTLGAQQNRLQSTIEGNATTSTNLSSAMSQIKDADYATEVSNMSKAQILQQAGTSVLAQANQTTQGVMSLLR
uniref:flagellin n=2 Tax=uncultured Kushneria sp. TaxID=905033 RepID=UPI002611A08D